MVQPIQYTPQFIKTDVGAIQDKLNARQGQYDAAYAGALGAEDQFGQFDVHAKDIDLKNKVIGGFRDRVKSLVDQYGGDYAAASKQLVKEIVNTKNDKFFKLAGERNKLAEEQRRLVQQYGPNAIILKDVTKPDLVDAQGNYIRPEDLSSEVLNREHFEKILDTDFGLLKNKKREGALTKSSTPGYLQSTTTQGITGAEVNQVAQDMYNTLKKTRPDLPDDIAINIANNQAKSYVLGSTNQLVGDKEWDLARQREEYARTHPQTPPSVPIDLFTENAKGASTRASEMANEFNSNKIPLDTAAKNIVDYKQKIADVQKGLANLNNERIRLSKINDPRAATTYNDLANGLTNQLNTYTKALEKGRGEYKTYENNISKKYKVYSELKGKLGSSKALSAIANSINESNEIYAGGAYFKESKETPEKVMNAFSNITGATEKLNPETGKYESSGKTLSEVMKEGGEKSLGKIGIEPGTRKIYFEVKDKAGKIVKHTLPIGKSDNQNLVRMQHRYDKIKDIYNGEVGLGLHKVTSDGNGKSYTATKTGDVNTDMRTMKPGEYIKTWYQNGRINSHIFRVGEDGSIADGDLNDFTKQHINQVARELGIETKSEPQKFE
jgi:hypothetical protein